jgi:hypothetical protein
VQTEMLGSKLEFKFKFVVEFLTKSKVTRRAGTGSYAFPLYLNDPGASLSRTGPPTRYPGGE